MLWALVGYYGNKRSKRDSRSAPVLAAASNGNDVPMPRQGRH